ncbi:MAG: beta-lactamase family protein [Phycisphaerales bacterium]|nr:beta-lactamase family protein [Hyphomonadaceae bacterium]
MRNWFVAAFVLALCPTAAIAQTQASPPQTLEQLIPEIDAVFAQYQRESHVPGLIYGIVQNGDLVHTTAMGELDTRSHSPVGSDSLFRIASMSKAFTALAILRLRDEGRLSLDATAETYVPEMRNWRYPTTDSPRIRVRDLLSHVGGFVTDDPWGDRQQVLSEDAFTRMLEDGVPFTRAPQTQFEYSNFGYALLGRIVSNVSGQPYNEYIEQEIMRPLGMASSGYDVFASPQERRALGYRWENERWTREPDMRHGAFGAMGGVQTSADDYARWVAFLLSAWPARDDAEAGLVRRSTVRELAQGLNFISNGSRPGLEGEEPCRFAGAYAMGFRVARDCVLGTTMAHGGGYPGYGSYLLLLPEYGVGIFAFANRTYAGPSPPVTQAALLMQRAGLLRPRELPGNADLARTYAAARAMFAASSVEPGRGQLAMNFLMDRSAPNWRREFQRIKSDAGACNTDDEIVATGALAGQFLWTCEHADIQGALLLAPTNPPTIQALRLNVVPHPN